MFQSAVRKEKCLSGVPIHVNDVCRMMKRRLRDPGLPENLSPHSFRVTTITDLLAQGVPLEDVQRLAGHSDPRTTRLYDRRTGKSPGTWWSGFRCSLPCGTPVSIQVYSQQFCKYMLTPAQKEPHYKLAERAKHFLRTGEPPKAEWLEDGFATVETLEPPHAYDVTDRPLILATLHRVVDLADRLGMEERARGLIGDHVKWALGELETEAVASRPELVAELIWYVVSYCVIEHRVGGVEKAIGHVFSAYKALRLIPSNEYLELRCRVSYALGRHHQSLSVESALRTAEDYYKDALNISAIIAVRNQPGDNEYASYRSSVILTALARLSLNRGQLGNALRDLYVAKVILCRTPDALTRSYANYLIGSILRQQKDHLEEAITLLKSALGVFRDISHARHYAQCRHELAKAYLNARNFRDASRTLDTPLPRQRPHGRAHFTRWDWNDLILSARIRFEQESDAATTSVVRPLNEEVLALVETDLREAIDVLDGDQQAIDIRARGLIVLCEVALRGNRADALDIYKWSINNMGRFNALLDCLSSEERKPLDNTDIGWGWLVIAEARIRRGEANAARAALAEVPRIENEFFSSRAKRLENELHTLTKGGRWFPPISSPITPHRWEHYEWSIKNWLMDEVTSRGVTQSEQARLLDVNRGVYAGKSWLGADDRSRLIGKDADEPSDTASGSSGKGIPKKIASSPSSSKTRKSSGS